MPNRYDVCKTCRHTYFWHEKALYDFADDPEKQKHRGHQTDAGYCNCTEFVQAKSKATKPIGPKDDWEALGITNDSWACVAVFTELDAKDYVWRLAQAHVAARVAKDPVNPKKWHVAVQGGLKASPMSWLVSIRGVDDHDIVRCQPHTGSSHVMPERP
jgi:hypothetical protein